MNGSAALASLLVLPFFFWSPSPPASAAPTAENAWASLLRGDVEAMHQALLENHPGAVDTINKGFSQWLEAGYRQALERAKKCTSYEGYRFALEAYAVGFKDGHLGIATELRRDSVRWPGFMVGWQSSGGKDRGKLVVRVVTEGKPDAGMPALGSELISCDGKPARELLERDVFPFSIPPEFEIGWVEAAPLLLVDEGNPWRGPMPQNCRFLDQGTTRDVPLRWRQIDDGAYRAHRGKARERPKVDFVIRPFGERGVWVGIPTFSPSQMAAIEALKEAIARAPSWRDRDPIVFDVRTNAGGSSVWGRQLLEGLYGKDFVTPRLDRLFAKEYAEWRASPGNVQYLNAVVASTVLAKGIGSEEEAHLRSIADGLAQAVAERKSLWRQPDDPPQPLGAGTATNPVAGRVVLLTDGACGSACLDFADMVRALPGTRQVGRTTAADSVYMEQRGIRLPSGIARLAFATKVYRNRVRGNNQSYAPHHVWEGSMADTPALERWILSLPRAR